MSKRTIRGLGRMLALCLAGLSEVWAADVTVSTTSIDFADAIVRTPRRFTLTVTNTSTTTPHTFNFIAVTDPRFTVCMTGADPCVAPATWPTLDAPPAATSSRLIDVEFTPTMLGPNPLAPATLTVDTTDSTLLVSVQGTGKGLDLILLIDNSGSMSWRANGSFTSTDSERRIFQARAAATGLVSRIQGALPSPVPSPAPEVRAGVCLFNHGTPPASSCPMSLQTFDSYALGAAINGITAAGGTPMGRGLRSAINQLPTISLHRRRVILMLSNGAHNTAPCPTGTPDFPCPNDLLDGTGITLYAIGYGTVGDVEPNKLLELVVGDSGNTAAAGLRHYVPTGSSCPSLPAGVVCVTGPFKSLDAYFVSMLQSLGLVQAAVDPNATIRFGQTVLHDVDITELDRAGDFNLSWEALLPGPVLFELISPDGVVITPATPEHEADISFTFGRNQMYYVVRKGYLKRPGKIGRWKMRVSYGSPGLRPDRLVAANRPDFTYSYGVTMPSGLELAVDFDRASYATGDPMLITTTVRANGMVLKGASIDRIETRVERPGGGIGSWYATHDPTPSQLAAVPTNAAADPVGPLQQKSLALRFGAGVDLPHRTLEPGLVFTDDGQNGDAQADDGIYTARYTDTGRPDTHTFYLRATGRTPAGTPFTREAMVQQLVPVNVAPDPKTSRLTLQTAKALGGITHVRALVVPKDTFGNFLGPGHSSTLDFQASAGSWLGPMEDDLRGGYSRVLEFRPASQSPEIKVTVQGKDFPVQDVKRATRPRFELGAFAGRFFFDKRVPVDDGPVLGVRGGLPLSSRLTLEAEIAFTPTDDAAGNGGTVFQAAAGVRWDLDGLSFWNLTPFVAGGVGTLRFSGFPTTDTSALVHFGGGFLARVSPRTRFRIDARDVVGLDTFGRRTDNVQVTLGVVVGF